MQLINILKEKVGENQLGIGLVETILSIGIAIIVLTSLVSLSIYTLRSTTMSKMRLQSTKLANQELELVRACRDMSTSWTGFSNSVSSCDTANCYISSGAGTVCGGGPLRVVTGSETISEGLANATRYFRVEQYGGSSDVFKVSVTVDWSVGPDSKSTHTYSLISNWKDE